MKLQTSWNLKPLFLSDDDPAMKIERKKIEEVTSKFVKNWKQREDFLKDPKVLAEALSEYESWSRNYGTAGKEGYYFGLRFAQNQNDPEIKAKLNQITDFSNRILNEMQFFELRISRIDKSLQKLFLDFPELQPFRHFLEKLFASAKYLLSEPEEKILNLKSTTSYENWERLTQGLLAKEERDILGIKKNFSEISNLLSDIDKKTRDSAAYAYNDILDRFVDVGEAEINSLLLDKKTNDELRGLKRPDEGRHVADDIESEVVDQMLVAVSGRFDLSWKFYELKAKLFKVSKLAYHERAVPFGKVEQKFTFSEAVELVHKVFESLDPQFARIFDTIVENGQVDVFPAKGKRGGAFCTSELLTLPIYVLLNFDGKFQSVRTLAHEFGHAINDELMKEKQNALNFHTSLATAEAASTFLEDFVVVEVLKNADEEMKLILMMAQLDEAVGTIFRQVAAYQFETDWHGQFRRKGYLSKEEIGESFQKHMKDYMGDFVEQSPGSANWWVQWPHFRSYFYVYSYASGLLISKSLQGAVKKDPKFISKVKEFLQAGTSDSPKNIFAKMGIDVANPKFWDQGLAEIEKLLDDAENLARKLGKI